MSQRPDSVPHRPEGVLHRPGSVLQRPDFWGVWQDTQVIQDNQTLKHPLDADALA